MQKKKKKEKKEKLLEEGVKSASTFLSFFKAICSKIKHSSKIKNKNNYIN